MHLGNDFPRKFGSEVVEKDLIGNEKIKQSDNFSFPIQRIWRKSSQEIKNGESHLGFALKLNNSRMVTSSLHP